MENKATNGFVFKKEFEEKEFLRKTFLSFARDSATPEDIIEADFGMGFFLMNYLVRQSGLQQHIFVY